MMSMLRKLFSRNGDNTIHADNDDARTLYHCDCCTQQQPQQQPRQVIVVASPEAVARHLQDPMRMGRVPDVLGSFVDPMGGRASHSVGQDPTCTGA